MGKGRESGPFSMPGARLAPYQGGVAVAGVTFIQQHTEEAAMDINRVPPLHLDDNPTNCCPRFHPEDWEGLTLHFRDKPFVRATVAEAMHIPLNMGTVFTRVMAHIDAAKSAETDDFIVLSRDVSPWKGEHFFAVTGDVPDEEMTAISGDFVTKVFEGPYAQAGTWFKEMAALAAENGKSEDSVWFYYTTCPKCAKVYGKNYVVGLAEV
jgi:hypothetical protein